MNRKPLKKIEVFNLLENLKKDQVKTEIINLFDAENRFLAKPITSLINLPPFNNSAVAGYAVRDDAVGKTIMLYLIYLQALIIGIFAYTILWKQKKSKKVATKTGELNL